MAKKCVTPKCNETDENNFYMNNGVLRCYCKFCDRVKRTQHYHKCTFEEAKAICLKNDEIKKNIELRKTATKWKCVGPCGRTLPRKDFEENSRGVISETCKNCRCKKRKANLEKRKEEDFVKAIFANKKSQAASNGWKFSVSEDYLKKIFPRDNCCILTGVKFDYKVRKGEKNPYAPSLDRIDSSKGYVEGNIRWICWWLNRAFAEWGEEISKPFLEGYARKLKENNE